MNNLHWAFGASDLTGQTMRLYDSMLCTSGDEWMEQAIQVLRKVPDLVFIPVLTVATAATKTRQQPLLLASSWPVEKVQCVQQSDGASCGVHTLVNMMHVVTGIALPTEIAPPAQKRWGMVAAHAHTQGKIEGTDNTSAADFAQHTLTALVANLEASLTMQPPLPVDVLASLATARTHTHLLVITQASTRALIRAVRKTIAQTVPVGTQLASARRVVARLHLEAVKAEDIARCIAMAARTKLAKLKAAKAELMAYFVTMTDSGAGLDETVGAGAERQQEIVERTARKDLHKAGSSGPWCGQTLVGVSGDVELKDMGVKLDGIEEAARELLKKREGMVAALEHLC